MNHINSLLVYERAQPADADFIVQFQLAMALETESIVLDKEVCTQGVRAVFLSENRGQYFICRKNDKVIASVLVTTEWSDWRNGSVWWIHSVYVLPEFRGQKVFSRFYEFLKNKVVSDPNLRGLRLYVDHSNKKAQNIYKKLGMNSDHYQLYEWLKSY